MVYKHCKLICKISWINKFESETPSSQLLYGYYSMTSFDQPEGTAKLLLHFIRV